MNNFILCRVKERLSETSRALQEADNWTILDNQVNKTIHVNKASIFHYNTHEPHLVLTICKIKGIKMLLKARWCLIGVKNLLLGKS